MYQALYRKWRPKTFDDVVGQAHISETLKRQITGGRLGHAYLFVGTRGTGKTTCAKILSRALNCEHPENGNPCNKCPSCVGIENGSILDVLELDAASNNGVDNVRALREEAVFTPVQVKKRVYIIDEVHMLSTAAFNALLKILEEPPAHLMFILATTEIHKVPATILSRCQRFTFKRGQPQMIAERLLYIAGQEGIALTSDAAELLARLADGSFRDALSLLDQCASEETVDYDRVLTAIGLAGQNDTASLLTAVADSDIAAALTLLDKLYTSGKVMASVLEELTNLVRDVLIVSLMPKGGTGLLSGGFDQAVLQGFMKRFTPEQLLAIADILRETAQDLSKSSGGRLAVELCIMRLCDRREYVASPACAPIVSTPRIQSGGEPIKAAPAIPDDSRFAPPVTEQPSRAVPEKPAGIPEAAAPVPAAAIPAAQPADRSVKNNGDLWKAILSGVKSKIDDPLFHLINDQSTAEIGDGTLTVKTATAFVTGMINVPPVTAALKEAASTVMGRPIAIKITEQDNSVGGNVNKLDAWADRFSGVVKVEE